MRLESHVTRAISEVSHEQLINKYEIYMNHEIPYNTNLVHLTAFDRVFLEIIIENFQRVSGLEVRHFYEYWGYDFKDADLKTSLFLNLKELCNDIYYHIEMKEFFDVTTAEVMCELSCCTTN